MPSLLASMKLKNTHQPALSERFMTKIQRLESMLLTDGGGTVGEAIRLCTRRIDQQQATLDDVRNRVRAQEANMEWSEENSENISGRENKNYGQKKKERCAIPGNLAKSNA